MQGTDVDGIFVSFSFGLVAPYFGVLYKWFGNVASFLPSTWSTGRCEIVKCLLHTVFVVNLGNAVGDMAKITLIQQSTGPEYNVNWNNNQSRSPRRRYCRGRLRYTAAYSHARSPTHRLHVWATHARIQRALMRISLHDLVATLLLEFSHPISSWMFFFRPDATDPPVPKPKSIPVAS